mmetsp:Transcript_4295/g.14252  ORF Transcript_4295/g.14252 Transcript_4295/m.14252 type:complete len:210 (-) Transcript_4295:520-1149(-)
MLLCGGGPPGGAFRLRPAARAHALPPLQQGNADARSCLGKGGGRGVAAPTGFRLRGADAASDDGAGRRRVWAAERPLARPATVHGGGGGRSGGGGVGVGSRGRRRGSAAGRGWRGGGGGRAAPLDGHVPPLCGGGGGAAAPLDGHLSQRAGLARGCGGRRVVRRRRGGADGDGRLLGRGLTRCVRRQRVSRRERRRRRRDTGARRRTDT